MTNGINPDRIRVYEQQKGVHYMSKVKQWAEDTAEKAVDNIVFKLKDGHHRGQC